MRSSGTYSRASSAKRSKHEFTAAARPIQSGRKPFKLADTVIDMHDVIARLEFGKIGEEAGSANFAAGSFDGGGNIEKIRVAKNS